MTLARSELLQLARLLNGHHNASSASIWLSANVGIHSVFHSEVRRYICLGGRVEKRGLGTVEKEGVIIQ